MELTLVNPRSGPGKGRLVEPPPYGYLLVSAAVEPPGSGPPRPGRSPRKRALLGELARQAGQLAAEGSVERATVYRALVVPPPPGYAKDHARRLARYDVVALVETRSPADLPEAEDSEPYRSLVGALSGAASETHVMRARCVKSLGDVPKDAKGLYLFNYFVAEDPEVASELWDHLAGWYQRATGLSNSTLLAPLGDDDFVFVNHARWDASLPKVMFDQIRRPSFRSYVQANMLANRVGAMPILYRAVI